MAILFSFLVNSNSIISSSSLSHFNQFLFPLYPFLFFHLLPISSFHLALVSLVFFPFSFSSSFPYSLLPFLLTFSSPTPLSSSLTSYFSHPPASLPSLCLIPFFSLIFPLTILSLSVLPFSLFPLLNIFSLPIRFLYLIISIPIYLFSYQYFVPLHHSIFSLFIPFNPSLFLISLLLSRSHPLSH